jgi:hypothetical protein
MTQSLVKLRGVLAVAALGAMLAACGGGGGSPEYSYETAEAPPEGALASGSSVLAFIANLAGSPLEGREPFNVDAFAASGETSDTLPPIATSIDQ